MSQFALESFGGYQKARQLFDLVVAHTGEMKKDPRCYRLIGYLREEPAADEGDAGTDPSSLDTRPPTPDTRPSSLS